MRELDVSKMYVYLGSRSDYFAPGVLDTRETRKSISESLSYFDWVRGGGARGKFNWFSYLPRRARRGRSCPRSCSRSTGTSETCPRRNREGDSSWRLSRSSLTCPRSSCRLWSCTWRPLPGDWLGRCTPGQTYRRAPLFLIYTREHLEVILNLLIGFGLRNFSGIVAAFPSGFA